MKRYFQKNIYFLFIFQIFIILYFSFFSIEGFTKSKPDNLGAGNENKISIGEGYFLTWRQNAVDLVGLPNLPSIHVDFNESAPKKENSVLETGVQEQDLGGNLKKKAPLAYKNPRVRNIQMAQGGDPSQVKGMSPKKITEVPTGSGKETTLEYGDGSKEVIVDSPSGREENFYDRKGAWVWKRTESESQGIKIKKTEWQDGSVISDYSNNSGLVSVIRDQERHTVTISFLNNSKKLIREFVCESNMCAEN